jgi:hypothetical protein
LTQIDAPHLEWLKQGALSGLKATGQIKSAEFQAKVGRVMGALKDQVKGRQAEGCAYTDTIANQAGVSVHFVYNVIESSLIEDLFGRQWAGSHSSGSARIVLFGPRRKSFVP